MINMYPTQSNPKQLQLRADLLRGDWSGLYQTAIEWLQEDSGEPIATFIQNIACLFINPPAIMQNKHYLETVGNKDWKAVLSWYKEFQTDSEKHNPYFQTLDFILQPPSRKKESIEMALQEHPNQPELLFLQAISLRDKTLSIEKLKLAVNIMPQFAAAQYLLGIFSLQQNQVEEAEGYLKQAVALAPEFLEAHYQLANLYTRYIPDATEQAKEHFEKVIELDPEGEVGKDAKKVLESNSAPQYGQRAGRGAGGRRKGISILTILGISLLSVVLFSGPIASIFHITSPLVGIMAGILVFLGLYAAWGRRK